MIKKKKMTLGGDHQEEEEERKKKNKEPESISHVPQVGCRLRSNAGGKWGHVVTASKLSEKHRL